MNPIEYYYQRLLQLVQEELESEDSPALRVCIKTECYEQASRIVSNIIGIYIDNDNDGGSKVEIND